MTLAPTPTRTPARTPKRVETQKEQNDTSLTTVDLEFTIDPEKTYIFETIKKSETPRYENLGSTAKAFDPVEKRYRDLRYLPTAPSIFMDEQDESFNELQPIPLQFYRNTLYAIGQDIRLIEFLMNHPLYEHSPFRVANRPPFFTLADKGVQEAIKAKRHETELKSLEKIMSTSIEDLRPIARNVFNIMETEDMAIKNALNDIVKKPKQGTDKMSNAEKFLDNLDNPLLTRKYFIQAGIDRGIIATDVNKQRATFVDGNVFICNLNGRSPVKELTDYSFTGEGEKFYTHLKSKIS